MNRELLATEPVVSDDVPVLRAIVEGTARSTGEAFFQSLVRHLAEAIDVHYAFVAEFTQVRTRVRTLAYWAAGRICDNIEFDLAGTPCEEVVRGSTCHHPVGTKDLFPQDRPLMEMGIESYLGVPLRDESGEVLGHLAVFDERPMPPEPRRLSVFRIFAARAAAELERLRAERLLRQSEQRYRDLYEEAPIAYLSTAIDGCVRTINRRAVEWLGYPAAEIVGACLTDFLAPTPAGATHGAEVLRRLAVGEEVAGLELELRRKDGSPLWVSWWMKPVRDSAGTIQAGRSIWVDITERVRAEAERSRLQEQNLYFQEEIKATHNFEEIIGRSPALAAVLDNVRRVAATEASVLISGETGTGKELIARAVHSLSRRRDRPLIKINCAVLPLSLVESELFGHEKGAFTGAIARRIGRFELAHGGTLFLDEIGEISAEAQAKLLRVLQEHEFERVGGNTLIPADVRIIAATNRDLLKAVRENTFREDLYYRLNVFPIALPPLRERTEDIPLLVHFFVHKFASRIGKRIEGVSRETMHRLRTYPWPGNVRELENILERAVILATGPLLEITADVLPTILPAASRSSPRTMQNMERDHILSVLEQTRWVINGPRGAAQILNLHPNTLRSRMKKLGIVRAAHEPS